MPSPSLPVRIAPVSLFLLALALGCSGASVGDLVPTPSGYQARLDALTGKSINVAIAELGAPTRTVEMAPGSKLYVWEEKSEMRTPITGEERYDAQTRSEKIVLHGNQRVPLDCFTELATDAAGIVVRSRTEGIACIATPPGPGYAGGPAAAVSTAPTPSPAQAPSAPSPDPTATPAGATPLGAAAAGATVTGPAGRAAGGADANSTNQRRVRRPGEAKAARAARREREQ